MFDHAFTLVARSATPQAGLSSTMAALLIVLLVLLILSLLLVAVLLVMRQKRRARKASLLPTHHDDETKRGSMSSLSSSHRRVMVRPSESVYVYQEKQHLFNNHGDAPPDSPIPEIRITFPEEVDDDGKRKSGRVVVVRVSDSGIGLEPVETLPAYEQNGERFHSVDLERVGGLVEKTRSSPQ